MTATSFIPIKIVIKSGDGTKQSPFSIGLPN